MTTTLRGRRRATAPARRSERSRCHGPVATATAPVRAPDADALPAPVHRLDRGPDRPHDDHDERGTRQRDARVERAGRAEQQPRPRAGCPSAAGPAGARSRTPRALGSSDTSRSSSIQSTPSSSASSIAQSSSSGVVDRRSGRTRASARRWPAATRRRPRDRRPRRPAGATHGRRLGAEHGGPDDVLGAEHGGLGLVGDRLALRDDERERGDDVVRARCGRPRRARARRRSAVAVSGPRPSRSTSPERARASTASSGRVPNGGAAGRGEREDRRPAPEVGRGVGSSPSSSSGARYPGVPMTRPSAVSRESSAACAMPKSMSTGPSSLTRRWTA